MNTTTPSVWFASLPVDGHSVNNGSTTAVDGATATAEFALRAASPNPFAVSTRIAFSLPRESHARLEVFDSSGRLVRTLLDASLPAGEHEMTWRSDDRAGRRARAGVYFYRLDAGGRVTQRKVVVLP